MHYRSTSVLASTLVCALAASALAQGTEGSRSKEQLQQAQGARRTPGRLSIPITGTVGSSAVPPAPTAPATPSAPPTTSELSSVPPSESSTTPPTETPTAPATPATPGVVPDVLGSFSIQRFARTTDGGVAAVGTLTVNLVDPASGLARTIITQAAMPVTRSGDASTASSPGVGSQPGGTTTSGSRSVTSPSSSSAAAQACETLSLTLEPIQLELRGIAVQLDRVNVDFTVVPGTSARLGVLLCGATGLMDSGVNSAERTNILNSLLETIG